MTVLPPCPECAALKCRICVGETWDDAADDFAPCPCRQAGHGDGEQLQHLLTCTGPDVSITNGLNRMLLTCRVCHAEVLVDKEQPGGPR